MAMQEPTFFILTALAEEPLHGYGLMRAVHDLSQGRLSLRASTLYAALDRLTDEGLLEVEREEVVDGRHRRYYRLTRDGATALSAEVDRMRHDASLAAARLRARGSGPLTAGFGLFGPGVGSVSVGSGSAAGLWPASFADTGSGSSASFGPAGFGSAWAWAWAWA